MVGCGCVLVVCCVLCVLVSGAVFGAGRDGPCGIAFANGHLGRICTKLGTTWAGDRRWSRLASNRLVHAPILCRLISPRIDAAWKKVSQTSKKVSLRQ